MKIAISYQKVLPIPRSTYESGIGIRHGQVGGYGKFLKPRIQHSRDTAGQEYSHINIILYTCIQKI